MMSKEVCSYDCSTVLEQIPSYSDISGIGVVAGYVSTAGLAVVIVILYYVIAYGPRADPFRDRDDPSDESKELFRPNPIDTICVEAFPRWLRRGSSPGSSSGQPWGIEETLIKCMLTMSDLQTLAGLSILIYHWQVIVYLAWFSSLTHLSCLTFLRNHLYNRRGERIWRLAAMGILAVMLVVALVPTANFVWTVESDDGWVSVPIFDTRPVQPGAPAICQWTRRTNGVPFMEMIFSVLLITFGFMTRIVRLHETLSIGVIGKVRGYLSDKFRNKLRTLHVRYKENAYSRSAKRYIYYRPLLALYLSFSVLLNIWTSMVFEIYWLCISFAWGVYKLILTRRIGREEDTGRSSWTFGQVIPLIMLAAPIIAFMEHFTESKGPEGATSPIPDTCSAPQPDLIIDTAPPDASSDNPDNDFYQDRWFRTFCVAILTSLLIIGILVFNLSIVFGTQNVNISLFSNILGGLVYGYPAGLLWIMMNIILLGLINDNLHHSSLVKSIVNRLRKVTWKVTGTVYFVFVVLLLVASYMIPIIFSMTTLAFWLVYCIAAFWHSRHHRQPTGSPRP